MESKVLVDKGVSDVENDTGHANGNSTVVAVVAGMTIARRQRQRLSSSLCVAPPSPPTPPQKVLSLFFDFIFFFKI